MNTMDEKTFEVAVVAYVAVIDDQIASGSPINGEQALRAAVNAVSRHRTREAVSELRAVADELEVEVPRMTAPGLRYAIRRVREHADALELPTLPLTKQSDALELSTPDRYDITLKDLIQELKKFESSAWENYHATPKGSYSQGTHAGEATAYGHAASLVGELLNHD